MSATSNPFLNFTDADLKAAMVRAMRLVAILTAIAFVALLLTLGWRTAMLLLAGALVSASGLWEWQKLIAVINAKLDGAEPSAQTGRVVAGFFLRLVVAGLVVYGSLRCFHGSVYAMVGGLGLAAFALAVEAVRLLRG
ncbi:MAG TPA: ATP synthase subunit I [Acidobacteriaceae bacterium]